MTAPLLANRLAHGAIGYASLAGLALCALMAAGHVLGCTARGDVGADCTERDSCLDGLQCFGGVCQVACRRHPECGDGAWCDGGQCVIGGLGSGEACAAEAQCGAGLSCQLQPPTHAAGQCVPETSLAADGESCQNSEQCRHGTCAFGRCVSLCAAELDCFIDDVCAQAPYLASASAPLDASSAPPMVGMCLPRAQDLQFQVALPSPEAGVGQVWLPVPSHARAMLIATQTPQGETLAGVAALAAPGAVPQQWLYQWPETEEQYYDGARYTPLPRASVMVWPPARGDGLLPGAYRAQVGLYLPTQAPVPFPARVDVTLRVKNVVMVELAMHVADLIAHPCVPDGMTAQMHADALMAELAPMFSKFGVTLRLTEVRDLSNNPAVAVIAAERLADLVEESYVPGAVNIYLVRGLLPAGQTLASTVLPTPAVARAAGHDEPAMPFAVSAAAWCYRDGQGLARSLAHAMARRAGLWETRDLAGYVDAFADTTDGVDNLMAVEEWGGSSLTASQVEYLRRAWGLQ